MITNESSKHLYLLRKKVNDNNHYEYYPLTSFYIVKRGDGATFIGIGNNNLRVCKITTKKASYKFFESIIHMLTPKQIDTMEKLIVRQEEDMRDENYDNLMHNMQKCTQLWNESRALSWNEVQDAMNKKPNKKTTEAIKDALKDKATEVSLADL